jgi:peptidoglycan/xylan/chitin deacetylase (PgdA/CDA1 family)
MGAALAFSVLAVHAKTAVPPILHRVNTAAPAVALTFDDGPDPRYTEPILKLLTNAHAHATFFVLGLLAERHPGILAALVRDGMEIGLHGMTHLNLRRAGAAHVVRDALAEQALLARLVPGLRAVLYRPPYGYTSPVLVQGLAAAHLTGVLWDVDTRDWTEPGTAAIVRAVERQVRPGSIVLFHDGGGARAQTVEALRQLLPWFRSHGYRLLTVTQLVATAGP